MKVLDLEAAAIALEAGEIVVMPTETVYGLAADAQNPAAVEKLFRAKGRAPDHPIACLVADGRSALRLCPPPADRRATVEKLIRFWPGPLTLLLPHRDLFAPVLTAGSPFIGLRVPDHDLARELLARMDRPLAVTSANRTGDASPTDAEQARAALRTSREPIAGCLDGGPCRIAVESSVVRIGDGPNAVKILREGALKSADFNRIDVGVE